MDQTLVLDATMRPVGRMPWQVAIVKVVCDRIAEVVAEYPDKYIRTPNWTIHTPSVIRLLKPVKRKRVIRFSRLNVWLRDGGRCQYCARRVGQHAFTYDHVVPQSQGGPTTWENVVVACGPCNQRKANRTPEQAGMRLAAKPVRPKKLPDATDFGMVYQPGMPVQWKDYLRSEAYWNVELEP